MDSKLLVNLKSIAKSTSAFHFNGKRTRLQGEWVELLVAIGKDETAYITMTKEAYDLLMSDL